MQPYVYRLRNGTLTYSSDAFLLLRINIFQILRINIVFAAEFRKILITCDQHDLGNFSGAQILKACCFFPGADTGFNDRDLRFSVLGSNFFFFLKKIKHLNFPLIS